MFENKIKEITDYITKEVDKRVDIIIGEIDIRIKEEVYKAYKQGYEDATEDVCRRAQWVYSLAFESGELERKAKEGIVEIDGIEDDIAEALGEETA